MPDKPIADDKMADGVSLDYKKGRKLYNKMKSTDKPIDLKTPLKIEESHMNPGAYRIVKASGGYLCGFHLFTKAEATTIVLAVNSHDADQEIIKNYKVDLDEMRYLARCRVAFIVDLTEKLAQETRLHSEAVIENIQFTERVKIAGEALGEVDRMGKQYKMYGFSAIATQAIADMDKIKQEADDGTS